MANELFIDLNIDTTPIEWTYEQHLPQEDPQDNVYLLSKLKDVIDLSVVDTKKTVCNKNIIETDFTNNILPYNDESWWGIRKSEELSIVIHNK